MITYRVTAIVSAIVAFSIAWLWYGDFIGIGLNEDNPEIARAAHVLQEFSLRFGVAALSVGVLNAVYFAFTQYRFLLSNRVAQALFGIFVPLSLFYCTLSAIYALALVEANKISPLIGYAILPLSILIGVVNLASVVVAFLKK